MTPTQQQIKQHFEKAKEIKCLRLGIIVDVSIVSNYSYNEKDNSWNSIGNIICFWKDGQFATITKKKCGPDCKGCKPCAQKRKNRT